MTTRTRTPRRRKLWVSGQTIFPILAATQGAVELLGITAPIDMKGHTLLRSIIRMTMLVQQDEAVGDTIRLDYGLVMLNRDAATASAFPDPEDPVDQADWLMLDHAVLVSSSLDENAPANFVNRTYDLSAQRKFGNRDAGLFLVFNNATLVGAADVNAHITSRILLAMP